MNWRSTVQGLWIPLAFLALWQALASVRILDPLFFPPPTALLAAAMNMAATGELWHHLGATLSRLFPGFLVGSICGVICGIGMGAVKWIRRVLEPAISALNSTPKLTLLPMLMLIFGIGETPRLLLVAVACFITMTMQASDAVGGIQKAYVELALNHGASRAMLWRKVYIPSALPQIFTGLRLCLGRALVISISIELVSADRGLGNMIWMAWQTFAIEKLYVGIIVAAGLGAFFHSSLKRLESRLTPWEE